MLLAVAVCSVVLLSINAAFFSALRLRNATTRAVEQSLPIEQALTILKRDLQCTTPPIGALTGDFKAGNVSALGTSENVALEFCTATGALRENAPWGDVRRVSYQLRKSPDASAAGRDLIRGVTRNLLSTISPMPSDQFLMANVADLQVSCYDGTQWLDTWDTSLYNTNLPVAVRVRIEMAGANGLNYADNQPIEIVVPITSQIRTNQISTVGGAQ